jgi:integrase
MSGHSVGSWFSEFTAQECGRRQATVKIRAWATKLFLQVVDPARPLESVTVEDVRKVQKYMLETPHAWNGRKPRTRSAWTVNTYLAAVEPIFTLAVESGRISSNPVAKLRNLRVPRREPKVYTEAEVGQLLRHARRYGYGDAGRVWETAIMVMITTAMRPGECQNLKVANIDFGEKTIRIAAVLPSEETDEVWRFNLKDYEDRRVPMPDELADFLAQRIEELPEHHPYICLTAGRYTKCLQRRREGTWREGDCSQPAGSATEAFNIIARRAGVQDGRTMYTLRSTRITWWLKGDPEHGVSGMPPQEVQRLAGHSSINTTMTFYAAMSPDCHQRAARASGDSLTRILTSSKQIQGGQH